MTRPVSAALSIVTAMLLFALSDNLVEDVAAQMSVWQYHAMRAVMILPGMALIMAVTGPLRRIWPVRPAAVFLRSAFTITALILYFAAIPLVKVSTAAAGLFTSPVFVILISVIAFGERVGPRRWLGVAVGFIGVCLVLGVGREPIRTMALAPMVGGAFYALNVIWTRRFCQQEDAGSMAFWNMAFFVIAGVLGIALRPLLVGLLGEIEGAAFLIAPLATPTLDIVGIVAVMGVLAGIGMVLIAWGYRSIPSTFAALFDFSFLFWVPLFAWLIRGQTVDPATGAGMALIVAAGALAMTGMREQDDT